ncbi:MULTISPECIES: DUF362 domain-containing protein [unclassified Halanaerobium]|uniref:DUF362 domain-containing protein n=1 Tax=unclassified Halanaerobium TaxID=2641197 RepID=UPI000DF1A176|nr:MULTISPECIES: DUF362 domain-containing protein [unclassified Halanaerobium]RCW49203.1 uncharacterized protein (DUF362 family) [Halanaerobium sp. MA284_MarDTE_T2]RCW82966.1 uncharacterized protein (DUF362 family) [Halanaerobium sp. DL-01]
MIKVSLKKCDSYNREKIKNSLDILIDNLGGWEQYIKKGKRVLLKTNLLMGKDPDQAVTTHPEILRAVGIKVKSLGAEVVIGDSPGGPFNENLLKRAYKKSGIYEMAAEEGFELNYNTEEKTVEFKDGKIIKSFVLGEYVLNADFIINLPKLKTHGLTMYTGAVKNLFGCIPGVLKAEYHLKMPNVDDFSRMLNDLALLVKPGLTIMDGIIGMEGDGPSSGEPRNFKYLLASESPFYLDRVAVEILGINPLEEVPLIKISREDGLIAEDNYQIVGDQLDSYKDAKIPSIEGNSNLLKDKMPNFLAELLEKFLRPKPVFDKNKCVSCRTCAENCPPEAIEMVDSFPKVDLDLCIRCFCCQELCPYDAVNIKHPWLGKLFFSR